MEKRLNLGCGKTYLEGWTNVDFNKEIKADIYCDFTREFPFEDNSVDEILLDNTLEHIEAKRFFWFMDEMWRACKNGAKIRIFVPHYTATCAFKHLAHYRYFGVGSFDGMKIGKTRAGERYNKARFNIIKEDFLLLPKTSPNFAWAYDFTIPLNWFFNLFGRKWRLFWEKFQIFGFEQIYYELEVVK